MLKLTEIDTFYGDLQALWGISLEVREGEMVSLIGPNGAGKTTTLQSITGLLRPAKGSITFDGHDLLKVPPDKIVDLGVSMVMEGGRVFAGMTVLENLELGAYGSRARKERFETMEHVFKTFPRLKERLNQRAGTLSGGERQMLAIGRAMMSKPKLLMLDEPSFGLAPILVDAIFEMVKGINKQGVTILLVEQNVRAALELADRAYVIENGRIVGEGSGEALLSYESVRSAYLG
ncbi:MAG: ABC transporter ATP-binding protein [Chloroflexi bacterium]|nr:ABC transporter ATP-binding protein [Chloroflexota bacterium]HOE35105.1 ABC transporter ATP-binding protein [Anaerolineaceae bacterium]HOT24815.1 ABC transporter ATP-binding protein [Anaerolineaceae bacterium]HQH57584.1 ABC transporter ATP-binding protein [Anaerolineaceae bacterium]HQK03142.1 ABC transporter ATP-binding protein [Anaerolineaceae bacterium]